MGKLAFVTLRDDSGTIQLYVDKSRLDAGGAGMKELKNLVDAGDFVGVRGGLRRTDRGELSVVAKSIEARPCCSHHRAVSTLAQCAGVVMWRGVRAGAVKGAAAAA